MGPLNRALREWEAFYNEERPRQSLGWRTPMEYLAELRLEEASQPPAAPSPRAERERPLAKRPAVVYSVGGTDGQSGKNGKMLDAAAKQRIIGEHQSKPGDTGSTEVQVALLSERIRGLTDHLRRNHKDHATRRGLLKLVGRRRRLLRYLAREDAGRYRAIIARLGLRR